MNFAQAPGTRLSFSKIYIRLSFKGILPQKTWKKKKKKYLIWVCNLNPILNEDGVGGT